MVTQTKTLVAPSESPRYHWLDHVLYVLLALVFLTAAVAKSFGFHDLESTIAASLLVPTLWASHVGVFLLVLEYLLAALLLLPPTRLPALQASAMLVSLFAAYSLWRWQQGITVPCHCFGVIFTLEPWQSLGIDIVLLGLIAVLLAKHRPLPR